MINFKRKKWQIYIFHIKQLNKKTQKNTHKKIKKRKSSSSSQHNSTTYSKPNQTKKSIVPATTSNPSHQSPHHNNLKIVNRRRIKNPKPTSKTKNPIFSENSCGIILTPTTMGTTQGSVEAKVGWLSGQMSKKQDSNESFELLNWVQMLHTWVASELNQIQ